MKGIEGFIFDMDGVITETSENHYLAWKLLAGSLGIHIDRKVNEKLKGISRMASLEVILQHGGISDQFSEAEKLQMATKKNKHYVEMIETFTEDNLMEGVMALLQKLRREGYKIGIASASQSAAKLVRLLGIRSLVDYVVDPSKISGKPKPDIFLKTAKGLGIDPEMCVGIEDAVAGIQAINAAGMISVGIGDRSILHEADIVYEHIADLDVSEVLALYPKI